MGDAAMDEGDGGGDARGCHGFDEGFDGGGRGDDGGGERYATEPAAVVSKPKRKRAPRKDAYNIVASRRYRLLPISTFNGTDFIVRRFFRAGL